MGSARNHAKPTAFEATVSIAISITNYVIVFQGFEYCCCRGFCSREVRINSSPKVGRSEPAGGRWPEAFGRPHAMRMQILFGGGPHRTTGSSTRHAIASCCPRCQPASQRCVAPESRIWCRNIVRRDPQRSGCGALAKAMYAGAEWRYPRCGHHSFPDARGYIMAIYGERQGPECFLGHIICQRRRIVATGMCCCELGR